MATEKEALQKKAKSLKVPFTSKTTNVELKELIAKAEAPAPAQTQQEIDAAALDKKVDADSAAPSAGANSSGAPLPPAEKAPEAPSKVSKDDGVESITPTGRFVTVGNKIFNPQGVLVGTEEDASVAARKADRFNSQVRGNH